MKRLVLATTLLLSLAACGRPFQVKTAPGFAELQHQAPAYDYRAASPEGAVFAVRAIEVPADNGADLDFYVRAVTLQMHEVQGYALTETADVVSLDGTKGKVLRFGHDENQKPYVYWQALYLKPGRLYLAEAGATKTQFEASRANLEWMLKSLKFD